jgi:hypothetical protein
MGAYTNSISLMNNDNTSQRFTSITYFGNLHNYAYFTDPADFPVVKIQVSIDGTDFFSIGEKATFDVNYDQNYQLSFILKLRNIIGREVRLYVESGTMELIEMNSILSKI